MIQETQEKEFVAFLKQYKFTAPHIQLIDYLKNEGWRLYKVLNDGAEAWESQDGKIRRAICGNREYTDYEEALFFIVRCIAGYYEIELETFFTRIFPDFVSVGELEKGIISEAVRFLDTFEDDPWEAQESAKRMKSLTERYVAKMASGEL